jgi:hypothetical protein
MPDPLSQGQQERERNLVAVTKYLYRYGCHIRIFCDKSSIPYGIPYSNRVEVEYGITLTPEGIIHRTKALNKLLRDCRTKYAAIYDADVVLPYEQMDLALARLEMSGETAVWPYSGTFWKIGPENSGSFSRTRDIRYLMGCDDEGKGMILYHCGGAVFVNRDRYLAIGGENENFIGYGPEDSERMERINKLGSSWRVDGDLYHLDHPILDNSKLEQPYGWSNQEEYQKVRDMPADELREYVKTWSWNV